MDMTGILSVEKVLDNSVGRPHSCHRVSTQSLFKDVPRGFKPCVLVLTFLCFVCTLKHRVQKGEKELTSFCELLAAPPLRRGGGSARVQV